MRRLVKLAFVVAVIAAVLFVAKRLMGRAGGPIKPTPWQAPTVEEAKKAAEDEGMTPPPQEPAEDVARGSDGTPLVSEFAAPGAPESAIDSSKDHGRSAEEAARDAEDEGMTPPPGAPAEDEPISSAGEPVVAEFAPPGAPEAELATEAEPPTEAAPIADDEGMTARAEHDEDVAMSSTGEPLISEFAASGAIPAAEFDQDELLPDFGSLLEEAEDLARGEALMEALANEPGMAETEPETDFLSKYFDELASTPEDAEPEAFAGPPADVDLPAAPEDDFLQSVEEALDDLEPAPIFPPPRRTAESDLDEGNVYFNVGQYGLAIERYGQAIALDDTLTAAFYNRANAHTRAGEFEKALGDYDRALALQPNDADALNNRGMLHLYRSNYPAALADFNGALEADPTDTTVMVNRGLAQLHGGNASAALADFQQASRMDEADAAAHYGAAQAAATMGNRDDALRHVTRALELDPGYAREAAGDQRLAALQGDEEFLRVLRQSGSRTSG